VTALPPWSASAFDASDNLLSSVSRGLQFPGPPAESFTLLGPGIVRVRFASFNSAHVTFNHPPIDNMVLTGECTVVPGDVSLNPGRPLSRDLMPTTMSAVFVPGATAGEPSGLNTLADACGFRGFDWVQLIDHIPSPSPFFAQSNSAEVPDAAVPIEIPPLSPIHDAPHGGYTYQFSDSKWATNLPNFANAFPFYYSPLDVDSGCAEWDAVSGDCTKRIRDTNTLNFFDSPKNPCFFGGSWAFTERCNFAAPLNPASVKFTTRLVGICGTSSTTGCTSPGMPSAPLYEWKWQSSYNGSSFGGVAETASGAAPPAGTGRGGVTITEINGVPQSPPSVSCAGSPDVLWPPNNRLVSVRVSGRISPGTSALLPGNTVSAVLDEYGESEWMGSFNADRQGNYSFEVPLVAARRGGDRDGRLYTIVVRARDGLGNVGICSMPVVVPHDKSGK
jgi:hypothetical protein